MKGNWVGFVTAALTFMAVAYQGYSEYVAAHPTAASKATAEVPVYWNDGQHWYCKVGDQTYIWRQNERLAWNQQSIR